MRVNYFMTQRHDAAWPRSARKNKIASWAEKINLVPRPHSSPFSRASRSNTSFQGGDSFLVEQLFSPASAYSLASDENSPSMRGWINATPSLKWLKASLPSPVLLFRSGYFNAVRLYCFLFFSEMERMRSLESSHADILRTLSSILGAAATADARHSTTT